MHIKQTLEYIRRIDKSQMFAIRLSNDAEDREAYFSYQIVMRACHTFVNYLLATRPGVADDADALLHSAWRRGPTTPSSNFAAIIIIIINILFIPQYKTKQISHITKY